MIIVVINITFHLFYIVAITNKQKHRQRRDTRTHFPLAAHLLREARDFIYQNLLLCLFMSSFVLCFLMFHFFSEEKSLL